MSPRSSARSLRSDGLATFAIVVVMFAIVLAVVVGRVSDVCVVMGAEVESFVVASGPP